MSNQKMTYILAWNGFVRERSSIWTNGIYMLLMKPGDLLLIGGSTSFSCSSSADMVDFLLENKICVECPINKESMDNYFMLNGFSKGDGRWHKSGMPEILSVNKRMGSLVFDGKLYSFRLLKKKLREYGCLEIKEILPKGRINV